MDADAPEAITTIHFVFDPADVAYFFVEVEECVDPRIQVLLQPDDFHCLSPLAANQRLNGDYAETDIGVNKKNRGKISPYKFNGLSLLMPEAGRIIVLVGQALTQ